MASCQPNVIASGLFLGSLFASVSAMTPTNGVEFLFPTKGVTLHYNDYVEVQYTSEFSEPWLYTFCSTASGGVSQKNLQGVSGYNSTALIELSWSGSDTPCWFDLKPSKGAAVGKGANSDNWSFDISQRAATTVRLSSSASATPAPSPTSSSTTTTATASETLTETPTETPLSASSTTTSSDRATMTSSASTTPELSEEPAETSLDESVSGSVISGTSTDSAAEEITSASSAGLSTGAQIGTGIGVAFAGIFVGLAAGIWYMRRRRQKARQGVFARIEAPLHSAGPASSTSECNPPVLYSAEMPRQPPPSSVSPVSELRAPPPAASELHASQPVYYELPSHTNR